MQKNPSEAMSVTEHVHEAWQLLLQLPDGERERVTEHLAGLYAWSEVEAGATALRRATRLEEHANARTDGVGTTTEQTPDAEITANLTPADVVKVRSLVEALRDGVVTVAELHRLPDAEWMDLIASRRAA